MAKDNNLDGRKLEIQPENLTIIGVDTDDDNTHPLHNRLRNTLPLTEEMIASVGEFGVIEPVVIRKGPNGDIQVIAGRQRVRAAREWNKRNPKNPIVIPYRLMRPEESNLQGLKVTENELRQDSSPLAKAEEACSMLDKHDEDRVCLIFGITKQTLSNWKLLVDASEPVKEAIRSGDLPATAALPIARLETPEQQEQALNETMEVFGPRVRVVSSEDGPSQVVSAPAKARKNASKAKAAKKAAAKAAGETAYEAPGKRELKKLVNYLQDEKTDLDECSLLHTLRWILGLAPPRSVKGLAPLLKEVNGFEETTEE